MEKIDALTLHDLRVVLVLSEVLHFGKSAEILGVSQPSLSQTIKKVESLLGVGLFDRSPRGCAMTSQGVLAVEIIEESLLKLSKLNDLGLATGKSGQIQVAVGMIPTMAHLMISTLLSPLLGYDTQLEASLTEGTTDHLVAMVANRELDCALVSLPIEHLAIKSEVVTYEELVLAVSTKDGNAYGDAIRRDEIPTERLVLLEGAHCLRKQALDICPAAEFGKRDIGHTLQVSTLLELVGMGVGLTILPASLENSRVIDDSVKLIKICDPVPQRSVAVIALRSRWNEVHISRFRLALEKSCQLAQSEVPYLFQ